MLIQFFFLLRKAGIRASITELLTLHESLAAGLADYSIDNFYLLARSTLVKDETQFDRFDQAFGAYYKGLEKAFGELGGEIPEEWLRRQAELYLSDEEKRKIESLGGFEELMKTLAERLKEQQERHQGGNKWIGTAGTSPFGAYGYNPEGIRIGQAGSRHRSAIKVWDKREFSDLDDSVELGTRNLKVALRKLRNFAREGAAEELDLDDTVRCTARNAGFLDVKMRPERHNAIKVLLFLDVGGSMTDHVRISEQLFSATRSEFKHLEYYYFHNFIYESVWKDNRRRFDERIPTTEVIHKFGPDYRLIFVGDAAMSPYEIMYPGGSVEHMNEEAGAVWMDRLLSHYHKAIWLNPEPKQSWQYTHSNKIIRELMSDRMFPLTPGGIADGIKRLS